MSRFFERLNRHSAERRKSGDDEADERGAIHEGQRIVRGFEMLALSEDDPAPVAVFAVQVVLDEPEVDRRRVGVEGWVCPQDEQKRRIDQAMAAWQAEIIERQWARVNVSKVAAALRAIKQGKLPRLV